jgi:hypothetical protein
LNRKAKQNTLYTFLQPNRDDIRRPEDIKKAVMSRLKSDFEVHGNARFERNYESVDQAPKLDPITKERQTIFSVYKSNEVPTEQRVTRIETRMLDDLRRRSNKMKLHQAKFISTLNPGFTAKPRIKIGKAIFGGTQTDFKQKLSNTTDSLERLQARVFRKKIREIRAECD